MKKLLIALVRLYQCVLSPALRLLFGTSGACRYSPTCSCYAVEALEKHGVSSGLRLTTGRLLRCHPWGSAGFDPVPPSSRPDLRPMAKHEPSPIPTFPLRPALQSRANPRN